MYNVISKKLVLNRLCRVIIRYGTATGVIRVIIHSGRVSERERGLVPYPLRSVFRCHRRAPFVQTVAIRMENAWNETLQAG